jgi:hypothetical protein
MLPFCARPTDDAVQSVAAVETTKARCGGWNVAAVN